MRRRRSPRVVWLPQDNFFSVDSATSAQSTWNVATETIGASGNLGETSTIIAPVVRDKPLDPQIATTSLSDLYSSGYRLRRIVGKIYCNCETTPSADGEPLVFGCTAGFIILRCNPQGLPQNTDNEIYNASIIINTEAPWIWRRSWILDNQTRFINPATAGRPLRPDTFSTGGNADGGHIDQKTARIVGPDERLFLVLTTTVLRQGDNQLNGQVDYTWEVRVLASLKTNVGNRRNASR